jgi:hypothetical protein
VCIGTKENGQRVLLIKLKKQKRRTILVLFIKLQGYYLVNFPPRLGPIRDINGRLLVAAEGQ